MEAENLIKYMEYFKKLYLDKLVDVSRRENLINRKLQVLNLTSADVKDSQESFITKCEDYYSMLGDLLGTPKVGVKISEENHEELKEYQLFLHLTDEEAQTIQNNYFYQVENSQNSLTLNSNTNPQMVENTKSENIQAVPTSKNIETFAEYSKYFEQGLSDFYINSFETKDFIKISEEVIKKEFNIAFDPFISYIHKFLILNEYFDTSKDEVFSYFRELSDIESFESSIAEIIDEAKNLIQEDKDERAEERRYSNNVFGDWLLDTYRTSKLKDSVNQEGKKLLDGISDKLLSLIYNGAECLYDKLFVPLGYQEFRVMSKIKDNSKSRIENSKYFYDTDRKKYIELLKSAIDDYPYNCDAYIMLSEVVCEFDEIKFYLEKGLLMSGHNDIKKEFQKRLDYVQECVGANLSIDFKEMKKRDSRDLKQIIKKYNSSQYLHLFPVSEKVALNFIETAKYKCGISLAIEDILLLLDNTIMASGKAGVALTQDKMIVCKISGTPDQVYLLDSISSIKKKGIVNTYLIVQTNDGKVTEIGLTSVGASIVFDILDEIINTLKN